jgi:glycosyltransferase involved in cell wall biosynthesis
MEKNPLISVIIPCYNRAKLIERALTSVKEQVYSNWECIIIDDGSSDNTHQILQNWIYRSDKFKVVTLPHNQGAQKARNEGIQISKGDWVAFLDSDNEFLPDKLEKQFCLIKNDPSVDIVTTYSKVIDETSGNIRSFEWITDGYILPELLKGKTYVDYNSTLIRKSKLFEIGLLDEKCPSFQEWDTNIRLAQFCKYAFVNEKLVNYYIHGNQISTSIEKTLEGYYYVFTKHQALWLKQVGVNAYTGRVNEAINLAANLPKQAIKRKWRRKFFSLIPIEYRVLKFSKHLFHKTTDHLKRGCAWFKR